METNKSSSPLRSSKEGRFSATHDEIAARARALWEQYGKPAGRDEMIWLEAERELLGLDFKKKRTE